MATAKEVVVEEVMGGVVATFEDEGVVSIGGVVSMEAFC